jgi:dTDP-4-dehydrorhamnose reductase
MNRMLITGGHGFFASRLARFLKSEWEIDAPGHQQLNCTEGPSVDAYISALNPDVIVHAAAIASTAFCNSHPDIAYAVNVDGSINVARAAKRRHAKLIFLSTEQVFNGTPESGPYSEMDMAVSDTVYGANKLEAEKLLLEITDEIWILRLTWMFGMPEMDSHMSCGILWDTIVSLINGRKIIASPHEYRGMTYVQDMLENIPKLMNAPYGIYHMGAANHLNRYETVRHILTLLGQKSRLSEILEEDTTHYLNHDRDIRLNTKKASSFGMTWTDTDAALERCLRDFGII